MYFWKYWYRIIEPYCLIWAGFPRPLSCNDIGLHECTFEDTDVMTLNAMPLAHTKDEKSIRPFFPSTRGFLGGLFWAVANRHKLRISSRNVSAYNQHQVRVHARVLHTFTHVQNTDGALTCDPWGTVDRRKTRYNFAETLVKQACAIIPSMVEWYSLQNRVSYSRHHLN